MPPDPLSAFHDAVRYGPTACAADLFAGNSAHVLRGLKVHANNIAHARRTALEETYPRLFARLGADRFHAVATRFLDQENIVSCSLDALGEGFELLLDDARDRDLARTEWAWLQSFHAAEADALALADLATITPGALVDSRMALHPAARLVKFEACGLFAWDEALPGTGSTLLLSRPEAVVRLQRIEGRSATLAAQLSSPRPCAQLLDGDPTPLLPLIAAGAIIMETPQ